MANKNNKIHMDYIHGTSIRDIIDQVNWNNDQFPENPILKEDIVELMKGEGAYILLYYK